jgi:hypothetical protein
MIKGYMIVKVMKDGVDEVIDSFDTLTEAEIKLSELFKEYEDEIIGYDDNYFTIENKYGDIITYQIIPIYKKDSEKKEKNFKIPVRFIYHVAVQRIAEIPATSYDEAVKILEKELEEGADPTDYEFIEEHWEYETYEIEKN